MQRVKKSTKIKLNNSCSNEEKNNVLRKIKLIIKDEWLNDSGKIGCFVFPWKTLISDIVMNNLK